MSTPNYFKEIPDGCQWGRSCKECPWPDCVLEGKRYSYESLEAVQLRTRLAACLHNVAGMTVKEAAKVMGVHWRSVYSYVKSAGGPIKEDRDKAIRQAYEAHLVEQESRGDLIRKLAVEFGVHERTVRRAVIQHNSNGQDQSKDKEMEPRATEEPSAQVGSPKLRQGASSCRSS